MRGKSAENIDWLKVLFRSDAVLDNHPVNQLPPSPIATPPPAAPIGRVPGKPATKAKKKSIYDYHWMAWKTGLTPTPVPPGGAPTPAVGFRSPSRVYTPIEEDVLLPEHLQDPNPPTNVFYRPDPPLPRSTTPVYRNGTPASMKADIRNNMSTPQLTMQGPHYPAVSNTYTNPLGYEKAMQAWINDANDYEKDVAYSLFTALKQADRTGGIGRGKDRPKTATGGSFYRGLGQTKQIRRPVTAGVRTSWPAHKSYNGDPNADEQYLNIVAKSTGSINPTQFSYKSAPAGGRPMHTHKPRPPPPRDFIHENATFMNAQLPYKSHFTIHPEFVSENIKPTFKSTTSSNNPDGLRYGSK